MPEDRTPHGQEAMHPPPDRAKIPEPKPTGREAGQPGYANENVPSGTPASPEADTRAATRREDAPR